MYLGNQLIVISDPRPTTHPPTPIRQSRRNCVIFVSAKMAASRFRSLSEENIAQLLNDKDSENTKMSTKQHRLIFESYLKEKNIRNPTTTVELAAVLRKFYAEARKKDGQMYSKNSLCSIRFSLFNSLKIF